MCYAQWCNVRQKPYNVPHLLRLVKDKLQPSAPPRSIVLVSWRVSTSREGETRKKAIATGTGGFECEETFW